MRPFFVPKCRKIYVKLFLSRNTQQTGSGQLQHFILVGFGMNENFPFRPNGRKDENEYFFELALLIITPLL